MRSRPALNPEEVVLKRMVNYIFYGWYSLPVSSITCNHLITFYDVRQCDLMTRIHIFNYGKIILLRLVLQMKCQMLLREAVKGVPSPLTNKNLNFLLNPAIGQIGNILFLTKEWAAQQKIIAQQHCSV